MGSFPWTSVFRACALATLLAASGACSYAQENPVPDSTTLRVIIFPFQNLSQETRAKDLLMPRIYEKVESLGLCPVSAETVDVALRRHRIRDTGQIGWDNAQSLSSENGSQWILLGSIDLYSSDLLQVGISARLLNSLTGDLVWADSRYAAEDETPSLLRFRKIKSAEAMMEDVLKDLFISLRQNRLEGRNTHISESPASPSASGRILIIPFDNVSGSLHADQMVNHIALSALFQQGFGIIEPGLVNEQARSLGVMPQGQIDLRTLKFLAEHFASDYCLTGSVVHYELSDLRDEGQVPAIELNVRLLDARRASPVWSDHIGGSGSDYIKIFQLGAIRSPGQLLQRFFTQLLNSMKKQLAMRNS